MTRSDLYGRQLGDFALRDCIDEGGFGAIYRCEQPLLGREAVVKVMHERVRADEEARRRFATEARLAAQLDHPYAAHVYAFGIEEDGLVWIAMELIHGVSLRQHLDDHVSMPLDAFVPFFERLADVVHAAHEQGIVHRDLKPANIMIHRGSPKLLDFGVAKLLGDTAREAAGLPRGDGDRTQRTRTGDLTPRDCAIGTPAYSSPEIWLGNGAGPPADVYALGVIAFEALTGRRPFRAETYTAFGVAHLTGQIPRTGDPALDRVFARALAKEPATRYESAADLAAALRDVLDGRRRRRSARRMGAYLGALMATVVFGGAVGRSRYEQRLSEQAAEDARETTRATAVAAEVEQGRAALLGGNLQEAEQHLGQAWQGGDRSWSTRFMLDRATQPHRAELHRFQGTGRMWSASWSPDGRWIVTTDDHGAQIWDGDTYQRLSPLPHEDTVYSAVWMDGGRVVTACGDGAVRIWDAGRGTLVKELRMHGHNPRWYLVAVSGERIAAVDIAGAVGAAWDVQSGRLLSQQRLDRGEHPAIAFSAGGQWLAISGGETVQVINTSGWHLVSSIPGQRIAWDPMGPRLLTGSASGNATIWNIPSQSPLCRLHDVGDQVFAVAYAPDGRSVALAIGDATEQVFDVSGRMLSSRNIGGTALSVEFDQTSRFVITATARGITMISEATTGIPLATLEGPPGVVRIAHFDPGSQRVVSASWDGTASAWDAASTYRTWSSVPLATSCGLIGGAEPDGRYLVVGCPGHPTRVWDTAENHLLAELPALSPPVDAAPVPYPVVSPAGDRAAIARGTAAEIYALPGGALLDTVQHSAAVTALAFEQGGNLVSGDASGEILMSNGAQQSQGAAAVDAIAVSGSRILIADARGHVRMFDHGAVVAEIDAGRRARMLRPSPDGSHLAVLPIYTDRNALPSIVDLTHGTSVRIDGPSAYTARWVIGGLLTTHSDGAVRLWTTAGAPVHVYRGAKRFLTDATFSPDGSMVVAGGGDGVLHFWDAVTERQLWTITAHRGPVTGVQFHMRDIITRGYGGEVARWLL